MVEQVTVSDLTQVGRANAPNPNLPRVYVTYNANFAVAADITLDFTLVNQAQSFGIPRSIFIDNGSNPKAVGIWCSITDQYFTAPAFSQGVYTINAAEQSTIRLMTDGGATDQVTVVIYNYQVPPQVWYSYGATNMTVPANINLNQVGGAATAVNNGVATAGTQRVAIASDNTPFAVKVDQSIPGTSNAVSLGYIGATAVASGNGVVGAGVQRVAIASDNTPFTIKFDLSIPGTTNGVSISHVGGTAVVTGGIAGSQGVGGNLAAGVNDLGNPVKIGGVYNSALPAYGNTNRGDVQLDANGNVRSRLVGSQNNTSDALADVACSIFYRDSQISSAPLLTMNMLYNGATWDRARGDTTGAFVVPKPATTGGLSPTRVVAGTTGVIKGTPGQLYSLASVRNVNAAVRYLHLYNKATAPTLGTDTPVMTISLLGASVQNEISFTDIGLAFSLGIAWSYTTDNIAIPVTAGTTAELMFSGTFK